MDTLVDNTIENFEIKHEGIGDVTKALKDAIKGAKELENAGLPKLDDVFNKENINNYNEFFDEW